ncbi:CapA family protein [Vibrio splendidus]|uniref:CapA family protein n=1 Tax=Vibrio splendidus TaxID=29497 RepID=A0ABV4LSC1_VIBSP
MNFYGDVNLPYLNATESVFHDGMKDDINVFNFESTIVSDSDKAVTDGIALRSNFESVGHFYKLGFSVACLANNHITDYDDSVIKTRKELTRFGFKCYGAGRDLKEALDFLKINKDGEEYYLISAGWDVIGCKYAGKDNPGVNPLSPELLKSQIKKIRSMDADAIIYCSFHYNYEFELYPQPADRLLFHELIDLGVDCIIGHHSHLIGPYELYNGKYIFYSLGNFYMPKIVSRGYELIYPDIAYKGIGVNLSESIPIIYSYISSEDKILHTNTNYLHDTDLVNLSDLVGKQDYYTWFKKNRIKNKLLPIFRNYDDKLDTGFKTLLVKIRNYLINKAVRVGLKK